jgi:hypothetical protein
MPSRGDYAIANEVTERAVECMPRRTAVTFSACGSPSRMLIVDGGKHYQARLADGVCELSEDEGSTWHPLQTFVSFDRLRAGEQLKDVRFDMIAAGGGRLVAKQRDIDRVWHLKLDHLFRTRAEGAVNPFKDPPVPGNYFKLDPEFFTTSPPSLRVPPELEQDYCGHPASLRFKAFAQLLQLGQSDMMVVMTEPRTWYLVDVRSPLQIMSVQDFEGICDEDFQDVLTKARIREVIEDFLSEARDDIAAFAKSLVHDIVDPDVIAPPLRQVVTLAALSLVIAAAVGPVLGAIGGAALAVANLLTGGLLKQFAEGLAREVRAWILANVVDAIIDAIGAAFAQLALPWIVDFAATEIRRSIEENGAASLLLPLNAGLWV